MVSDRSLEQLGRALITERGVADRNGTIRSGVVNGTTDAG